MRNQQEVIFDAICKKGDINLAKAGKIIADYSGSKGMLVGQVVDIESEGKEIDKDTLLYIHDNKTGGLIKASLMAGALIGGASEKEVEKFKEIGYKIGMAFQIKDDILDVTSTTEVLGKPVLSDVKNNKITYVSLFGMEKAKEDFEKLSEEAVKLIGEFGEKAEFLQWYAKSLINRNK